MQNQPNGSTPTSPLFNVGSSTSGDSKQVDLVLRINQSGNLDTDDSVKVIIYVNGSSYSSYSFAGNNSNSVFSINPFLRVPSNGTYQVMITMFTTASNEFWTIKNGDFTTCVIEPTPLPITLVDFDAMEDSDGSALITWVTQSEKINDYFTLERSTTGDVFEPLAKLDGAGTSTEMRYYKFIDRDPLNGTSYYRLSQTDFDGKVTVCGLITFHLQSKHVSQPVIVLRNNPFKDQLSISVNSLDATKVSVRLISSSGKESFDQNVPLQSGKNSLDVPINHELLPGIYTLVVTTDIGDQLVAKAVKR
ncbi:MAG: hypothetical protein ACKOYC_05735 [Bacteroidota bacterium]